MALLLSTIQGRMKAGNSSLCLDAKLPGTVMGIFRPFIQAMRKYSPALLPHPCPLRLISAPVSR
jgi:hypothetical protein